MGNFAKIISSDTRFARMLSIELSSIGVEIVDNFDGVVEGELCYVVADLDSVNETELREYSHNYILVGFSRFQRSNVQTKAGLCEEFLQRPFLIVSFLSIFKASSLESRAKKRYAVREETKKAPLYLSVSEMDKSAVWGDERIPLSDNEYRVLSILCDNRCEIVEREKISALLGAEDGNMGDVYICHLRRKIDNKLGLKLIYTIRGKGYMLKN